MNKEPQEMMTELVYDTLMGNNNYKQLDLAEVSETECDPFNNRFSFMYEGKRYCFEVTIK